MNSTQLGAKRLSRAAPDKEHNGGKCSGYQTTAGHHALTEFNPPFFIAHWGGGRGGVD